MGLPGVNPAGNQGQSSQVYTYTLKQSVTLEGGVTLPPGTKVVAGDWRGGRSASVSKFQLPGETGWHPGGGARVSGETLYGATKPQAPATPAPTVAASAPRGANPTQVTSQTQVAGRLQAGMANRFPAGRYNVGYEVGTDGKITITLVNGGSSEDNTQMMAAMQARADGLSFAQSPESAPISRGSFSLTIADQEGSGKIY